MEYIKSKDIFLLVRDTLKIVYPRLMKHGSRVAYMVYTMLREEGKYEEFELADMVMVATLHDIGAYKTERDKLGDYDRLKQMNYSYKDVAAYINIAEKMDHYSTALGDKFEMGMFQKYAGTKLSDDGLFLFYKCEEKYGMFEKIRSGAYLKELDDIIEYMIFNNEDKKKFLEMLMYCQGFFRSEMVETAMAVCISEEIAREMSLPQQKREILHYGTLLHDIGMLSIPRELIETPRKLEPKEAKLVKTHVETAGKILGPRMKKEVVDIVLAHHERCDGSGYPRQLTDSQMSTEQKILQVTDMVVALLHKRSYRKPLPKEKIVAILEEKTSRNVLKRQVVSVVVQSYDKIMSRIGEESAQILRMYETLNKQYELISKKYNI